MLDYLKPTCTSGNTQPQSDSETSFVEVQVTKDDQLMARFKTLTPDDQMQFLSEAFCTYCAQNDLSTEQDFVKLAFKAMMKLKEEGKHNVVYDLCKGLGTCRPDGTDSYFPTKRMPMGLLQYLVQFFISEPGHRVG